MGTVLVTGSHGFIGKMLTRELMRLGHRVAKMDYATGHDITTHDFDDEPNYDRVYHLAAQTKADCKDALLDAEINIMGLLRVLRRYGPKVVFPSSSMRNFANRPYAISKLAGEYYTLMHGGAVVRLCNIFGPGGHSFIDRCEADPEIIVHGDGLQVRSWAHVDTAIAHLISAQPGAVAVVYGKAMTVREIAERWRGLKPITYRPDLDQGEIYAPQL